MCSNIARERTIAIGIEQVIDRWEFMRWTAVERRRVVAHVLHRAGAAGDKPPAEPSSQWIALIDVTRYAVELRVRPACRAEHQKAGHAECVSRHMAAEAFEGTRELRRGRTLGGLPKLVEDDPLRSVVRGDLDHLAVAHPSKRDAVVEVQRTRILIVDQSSLQASA